MHEFVNPHMGLFVYSSLHGLNDVVDLVALVACPLFDMFVCLLLMHGRLSNTKHMITKWMFSALEF